MEFGKLMRKMVVAACTGDGNGVADCFVEDGIYDDVFYGVFQGREQIVDMIGNYFYRDACNFRWDLHDPVYNGNNGYVRYVFSYESKLDGFEGNRAMFDGVSIVTLQDGLIGVYKEIANTAPGLQRMGFGPERLGRVIEKQGSELAARDESRGHLK
jgi:hypothetical protein